MSLRASDADRNAAVERLREAFAEGRLDEDEFDERMRTALAARTVGQLDALFTDLPPVRVRPAAPRGTGSEIRLTVAVLSGARRKGAWRVPAASTAVAVMGGCELDLRAAELTAQVTTITAVAVMGGVDIIVPPDVRAEVTGFGLMGGWDDKTRDEDLPPDAPLVRVRAFTLMGGVNVKSKERKSTQGGR